MMYDVVDCGFHWFASWSFVVRRRYNDVTIPRETAFATIVVYATSKTIETIVPFSRVDSTLLATRERWTATKQT